MYRNKRAQAAIEYLSYFVVFLLIATAFSTFVFTSSNEELSKRSQERFKSMVFYVSQGIIDANEFTQHADYAEVRIPFPTVVKGAPITINGSTPGLIVANTTDAKYGNVTYYVRTGELNSDVCMEGEYTVLVGTEGEEICEK